jgi:redox-sensing transcriptional repressor
VAALFDVEEDLIGVPVGGIPVDHIDDIARICAERAVSIGVVATPPSAAQLVCDRLVSAGVRCILNFAPVVLQVPDDVEVRKVDLAVEMQILSFHVARRADEAAEDAAAAGGALPEQASGGGAHRADGVRGRTANGRAGDPVNGAEVSGVNGMVIRR